MSRRLLPVSLASVAFLGWLAISDSPTSAKGQATTAAEEVKAEKKNAYKLVAPLDAIMYVADEMFYDLEELIEEGKFRTTHRNALFLAEVSNVVAYANVEAVVEAAGADAKKEWKELANQNREDFLRMAEVSKTRDGKKVKSIWTTVEETCDSCHEKFRDV